MFITYEQELITISKDNAFKVELASYVRRNQVYMCNKHQVSGNDLAHTCLELYRRSEQGVQQHCRF
jgi:hypothetical protein